MIESDRVPGFAGILLTVILASCATPRPWQETAVQDDHDSGPPRHPSPSVLETGKGVPTVEQSDDSLPAFPAGSELKFLAFPEAGDDMVARLGDEALRRSQVYAYMYSTMPDQVKASIAVLVGNRVLASECGEHGIRVSAGDLDRWLAARMRVLEKRAALEFGKETTVDRYLVLTRGQSRSDFEEAERNREHARRLMERLIRYKAILNDRVELRIISLSDQAKAGQVRKHLNDGADFSVLARQYSLHPSAERGGIMYPIWRDALNPSLRGAAFSIPVGEISDVMHAVDDANRDRYQIIKVVGRHPGRSVPFADVEDEILSDLKERPLSQDEYLMWQLEINRLVETLF